ncbi:MAG: phosphoribosylformylglycinamidine cyclo-ligase [Candidatus Gracilibacteria bacterium]
MPTLTYNQSGVNINEANAAKKQMAASLKTKEKRVLNKIGAFASLYDIRFPEYKEPVLVLKTEEPGSKQLLAFQHDRVESICYDMINHLINDCIVMGARPLSVQDAVICGKLEKTVVTRIVAAVAKACQEQECVLTGGETSEQPGMLKAGNYVLTSSIVGIVEKKNIIDGSKIKTGDIVIALESSGLHTNGYTLVRALMKRFPKIMNEKIAGRSFFDAVMEPHRCYYKTIKDLFKTGKIHGMAHITGGGIKENLNRILPANKDAVIDLGSYQVQPLFKYIKEKGNVEDAEMLRTFNMGVGLAMVVTEKDSASVMKHIKSKGVNSYKIGKIVSGHKTVRTEGKLVWA